MSTGRVLAEIHNKKVLSSNPDNALVNIAYNNSNLQYLGRWIDTGSGKYSGWGGSCIRFKMIGSGVLNVQCACVDGSATGSCNITVFVDGAANGTGYAYTTAGEIITQTRTALAIIPNTGQIHTIEINTNQIGSDQFDLITKMTVSLFASGSLSILSSWTQGATRLQCIGDSWMSGVNAWTRLLSDSTYELYQIGNGGFDTSEMDAAYNYDYNTVLNTTDPVCGKCVISFGVNDYNASITVPNFQTSLLSIIDKVRIKQPGIPIKLVRVPNNGALLYGQYGTAMNNIVALRTGITYIDTSSIDATVTWNSDTFHLDGPGKVVMKNFVESLL